MTSSCMSLGVLVLSSLMPADLAGDHFAPVAPEVRVNEYLTYSQDDAHIALDDEGNYVVVWSTLGDIACRVFERDGTPRTAEIRVNTSIASGLQDFPMAAFRPDGETFIVVWNDWHGNDGFQMGCFGRLFDKNGNPLSSERQLNDLWQYSQFDPVVAMGAGGDFIVTWSDAGRDGIAGASMRRFAADFTPITTDLLVNTPSSRSQVDPVVAIDRLGRFVISFTDASADFGEPRNVVARVFDADGSDIKPPFRVHQNPAGKQRHPCVAMSEGGRWIVTWQDEAGQDGSGMGVFARVFEIDGTPVTDDLLIPENTAGDQWRPAIACDGAGNFVVIWEDLALGHAETWLRRYDMNGVALTTALRVNTNSQGFQGWPYVDLDDSGQDVVAVFTGEGDVWTRRYRTEPLEVVGDTRIGETATILLTLVGEAGHGYVIATSFDTDPGLDLGRGRVWSLRPDALFYTSLTHPNRSPFGQLQGLLGTGGRGVGTLEIPRIPALIGTTIHIAAAGLELGSPSTTRVVRVTEPYMITIQ